MCSGPERSQEHQQIDGHCAAVHTQLSKWWEKGAFQMGAVESWWMTLARSMAAHSSLVS